MARRGTDALPRCGARRGDAGPARAGTNAPRSIAGAPRSHRLVLHLDNARRCDIRVGVRRSHPGAQRVRGRAARPHGARRVGLDRSSPTVAPGRGLGRNRDSARRRISIHTIHRRGRQVRHTRDPAHLVVLRAASVRIDLVQRLAGSSRAHGRVRARSRALGRPRADDGARLVRRRRAVGVVGPARLRAGRRGRPLPGDPWCPARLDRRRGAGWSDGRDRLDGSDRPLHRQSERVLQSVGRAGLLHRRPDAQEICPRRASPSTPTTGSFAGPTGHPSPTDISSPTRRSSSMGRPSRGISRSA